MKKDLTKPCPSCGRRHRGLRIYSYRKNAHVGPYRMIGWSRCPKNGAPIFWYDMRVESETWTTGSAGVTYINFGTLAA